MYKVTFLVMGYQRGHFLYFTLRLIKLFRRDNEKTKNVAGEGEGGCSGSEFFQVT